MFPCMCPVIHVNHLSSKRLLSHALILFAIVLLRSKRPRETDESRKGRVAQVPSGVQGDDFQKWSEPHFWNFLYFGGAMSTCMSNSGLLGWTTILSLTPIWSVFLQNRPFHRTKKHKPFLPLVQF